MKAQICRCTDSRDHRPGILARWIYFYGDRSHGVRVSHGLRAAGYHALMRSYTFPQPCDNRFIEIRTDMPLSDLPGFLLDYFWDVDRYEVVGRHVRHTNADGKVRIVSWDAPRLGPNHGSRS